MTKTKSNQSKGKSRSKYFALSILKIAHNHHRLFVIVFATAISLLMYATASAQDGNAGITEATMRIRSYFATGTSLMYAIGSVVGLVGAVKVFQKWNSGDQDTGKVAAAWFGSCVFLVIVATVLRSFFGV